MKKCSKRFASVLIMILTVSMSSTAIFAGTQKTETGTVMHPSSDRLYASDELIVVYKESATSTNIDRHIRKSSAVDAALSTIAKKQKMAVIKLDENETVKEALNEYADSPIVDYVQPNYIYRLPAKAASTKSTQQVNKTWHLSSINLGGARTRYNELAETAKTSEVRVVVLDTGADVSHEDLQQSVNKELSVKVNADNTFTPLTGDSDIFDGHGTHVCGIIGATANNSLGSKGVASSVIGDKLDLVAVDIFDFYDDDPDYGNQDGILDYEEYGADTADIVNGLDYARKIGADIINMSIGSYIEDKAEKEAIARCVKNGITIVSAAGNDGTAMESFPADYDGVFSVIATDETGNATDWSNYGSTKDISAPGENIYSTIPTTLTGYDDFGFNTGKTVETTGYTLMSGTSMAAPVVTGVFAIMRSIDQTASKLRLENSIRKTAKDIGPEGRDAFTGYGLVNAGKAAEYMIAPITPTGFKAALSTSSKTSSTNYRTIKVSWNKMKNATGYQVAYKPVGATKFSYKTVAASKSTTTLKLTGGKKYQIKVRAYRTVKDRRNYSRFTQIKTATTLKRPTLNKITKTKAGNYQLKWTNINGESGYQVYKKKGKNGKWYTVKWKKAGYTSFIDNKINKKYTYYYKVRAYKNVTVNGVTKKVYGPWSYMKSKS